MREVESKEEEEGEEDCPVLLQHRSRKRDGVEGEGQKVQLQSIFLTL